MVDSNVRLEATHVVEVEAVAEEVFFESSRRSEVTPELVLEVAAGVDTQRRIPDLLT